MISYPKIGSNQNQIETVEEKLRPAILWLLADRKWHNVSSVADECLSAISNQEALTQFNFSKMSNGTAGRSCWPPIPMVFPFGEMDASRLRISTIEPHRRSPGQTGIEAPPWCSPAGECGEPHLRWVLVGSHRLRLEACDGVGTWQAGRRSSLQEPSGKGVRKKTCLPPILGRLAERLVVTCLGHLEQQRLPWKIYWECPNPMRQRAPVPTHAAPRSFLAGASGQDRPALSFPVDRETRMEPIEVDRLHPCLSASPLLLVRPSGPWRRLLLGAAEWPRSAGGSPRPW